MVGSRRTRVQDTYYVRHVLLMETGVVVAHAAGVRAWLGGLLGRFHLVWEVVKSGKKSPEAAKEERENYYHKVDNLRYMC